MKRRELLTGLFATSGFALSNGLLWKYAQDTFSPNTAQDPLVTGNISDSESVRQLAAVDVIRDAGPAATTDRVVQKTPDPAFAELKASPPKAAVVKQPEPQPEVAANDQADRILDKVRNFEQEFADDIYLNQDERILMHSVLQRLSRAEALIGHGNYNICSFDYLLKIADRYSQVGSFSKPELAFIERLFFEDATNYGFLGDRVSTELTATIADRDVLKIPYSGQYVFRGESEAYYQKIKKDIGDSIILTSGIRSNVKQMHLFLAKASVSNYNLSKASRSLAPPGHSYHGIGDFDVGKVGWGIANFSDKFAETDEFKRMQDLGYVQIRYTEDNRLGVRFEPWHIKVV
ncbi:M15 family metallopeptidase [Simiduia agarivorans]|uniref:Peptidase M15B and M15C, D,D-carboxypeptidase VanY/endolysin n=1 Tax=Simiduia agarivorans (strain DSM 21679 / JCM 13881 / BCRC 17597 / SA1) TaxID=1117647 RepID=K4KJK4_SIMAS|nr:M15 family metallopeptidase [Simiduia agarivorans]AFU98178.1 peptidase M15B and M15C, D,D-carboxypeptidase VanY/endolysin [Simiduia agarivorans SA1 = DSM 21679]